MKKKINLTLPDSSIEMLKKLGIDNRSNFISELIVQAFLFHLEDKNHTRKNEVFNTERK
jgi:hypothetical protein